MNFEMKNREYFLYIRISVYSGSNIQYVGRFALISPKVYLLLVLLLLY